MPEYINNTKKNLTFEIDEGSITLIPKQTIKTDTLYNHIADLTEKSPFPNLTPVVQEDFISGSENEEIEILITPVTKLVKILNRSGADIILYYNSSETQGMCIISQISVTVDFSDPLVAADVKKIVIKLLSEVTNPRGIIVDQYRFSNKD